MNMAKSTKSYEDLCKDFVHLHLHSEYSFIDGVVRPKEAIQKAEELGMSAIAITDHGSIDAWTVFDEYATKKGINVKVLYGVEGYEAYGALASEKVKPNEPRYFHSVFIAKNRDGLRAIRKLVTYSNKRENLYYKPRYDLTYLKEHKEEFNGNVIWLSACINGRIPQLFLQDKREEAQEYLSTMIDIFGKENVFVEIQNHNLADELKVLNDLAIIADLNGVGLVATNDVHYITEEDFIARQIMIARNRKQIIDVNGNVVSNKEKLDVSDDDAELRNLYFKTGKEMTDLFIDFPDAIENTKKIADMCEKMVLAEKDYHYPEFPIPEGHTPETYMAKIVWDNFPKKYDLEKLPPEERKALTDRTAFEIKTIQDMNVSAYMLIDSDFTVWAKANNIPVGPGRGSACGSVVAYCLGITEVEPVGYQLFFERKIENALVKTM